MANRMRWRYGDTNPVMLAVDPSTVIEIGDLVYFDTDDVRPAAMLADQGTPLANQELFHDQFAGVAMQASAEGESRPIRVATSGVFELDCADAAMEVGDLVGATENDAGTALENQQAVGVVGVNLAIGRCARRGSAADSTVLVDIVSTLLKGGPQAAA